MMATIPASSTSPPLRPASVPAGGDRERLRDVQMRLGTAGTISTDDLEMFAACQTGVQAPGMDWVLFSRGLHREVDGPDGERVGAYTDETPQRALYRGWLRL